MQDILDRADVARSTFYAHFLDKEDLLVQGIAMFSAELDAHVRESQPPADGPEPLLNSRIFFIHAGMHHAQYRAMQEGGGADVIFELARVHIIEDIEKNLGARVRDGNLGTIPLPVVSHFLAGAMLSVLMWWLDAGRPYTPDEIDAMFQALAVDGVKRLLQSHPTGSDGGY